MRRLFVSKLLSVVLKVLSHDWCGGLLLIRIFGILETIILWKLEIISFEELLVSVVIIGVCFLKLLIVILLALIQHFVDEIHRIRSIIFIRWVSEIVYKITWWHNISIWSILLNNWSL